MERRQESETVAWGWIASSIALGRALCLLMLRVGALASACLLSPVSCRAFSRGISLMCAVGSVDWFSMIT